MKNSSNANKEGGARPLLVYDADCAFCTRWIERWKVETKGRVDFEPYQTAAARFPQVSEKEFQKSVYLFQPDYNSRAAEAVFRTLAYEPRRRWMLWAYHRLPGFRAVSETFYALVAANRVFFSQLTIFLWGRDLRPATYTISQNIFLKCLAGIYAIAFASLFIQIPGLYGASGICPAGEFLQAVSRYAGNGWSKFWLVPSLAWLNPGAPFLQGICAAGILFAAMVLMGRWVRFSLFALWFLYLSLCAVGQDFLSFQWDMLLLETGFIAMLWAPPAAPFARILLVLLNFKLLFSSGMVKLASGDPAWRNLTALDYHYWTQPLPNPVSWFAAQLPSGFHRVCTAAMLAVELAAPFLLFLPRNLKKWGIAALLALQAAIFATGNYCFFNLLAAALCLPSIDDALWPKRMRRPSVPEKKPFIGIRAAGFAMAFVFCFISSTQIAGLFRIRLPWSDPAFRISRAAAPFNLVNSYGLFAVMTQQRREIFVEGSYDGKQWFEYEFKYKPGNVDGFLPVAAPHQPRLDWQMWFAALGRAESNRWFMNFCLRLLEGSPDVLRLLKTNPFPGKPPRFIRAVSYQYRFTGWAGFRKTGAWWKREYEGLYLPPMSLKAGSGDSGNADDKRV